MMTLFISTGSSFSVQSDCYASMPRATAAVHLRTFPRKWKITGLFGQPRDHPPPTKASTGVTCQSSTRTKGSPLGCHVPSLSSGVDTLNPFPRGSALQRDLLRCHYWAHYPQESTLLAARASFSHAPRSRDLDRPILVPPHRDLGHEATPGRLRFITKAAFAAPTIASTASP